MQDSILEPAENDVLSAGRGSRAKNHPGNMRYQSWVNELKEDYMKCVKSEKPCYAKAIVTQVKSLNPPGRFLKLNEKTGLWSEIETKYVLIKIRQALRKPRAVSVSAERKEEETAGGGKESEGG